MRAGAERALDRIVFLLCFTYAYCFIIEKKHSKTCFDCCYVTKSGILGEKNDANNNTVFNSQM